MPQDNSQVTPITNPTTPMDTSSPQDGSNQPVPSVTFPDPSQPSAGSTPTSTDPAQDSPDLSQGNIDPIQDSSTPAPDSTNPIQAPADSTTDPSQPLAGTMQDSNLLLSPSQDNLAPSEPQDETQAMVVSRISESKNVLIALSSDPSVDEMAAAIGLSLFLDKIGKRATAIYSGSTPNALEFLKPEETFESTADTLQDFVIALNKDKADHLRYKLDGDYVKVYITPYRHRISEEDLEFSYGDYNVDLVLALDVANGIDLDAALREHGRIMHDAVIINITTGNPGKFGEIEWSNKTASSVSEMIADLLYKFGGDNHIEKDEATAFLTGIVAATNRFSNAKTTPFTMQLSSRLMESGANQQLVAKNITPDVDNELISFSAPSAAPQSEEPKPDDPTKLDIEHDYEKRANPDSDSSSDKKEEIDTEVTKKEHTLLDDLKAAEQSLAQAGAETTPVEDHTTLKIDSESTPDTLPEVSLEPSTDDTTSTSATSDAPSMPSAEKDASIPTSPSITPFSTSSDASSLSGGLPDLPIDDNPPAPQALFSSPDSNPSTTDDSSATNGPAFSDTSTNPASASTPSVPSNPEINGVPEMNFMPLPGQDILPPPPTPPIEMQQNLPSSPISMEPIQPATPTIEPEPTPLGSQPAMQDQVYHPQAADPSAFKIPGM